MLAEYGVTDEEIADLNNHFIHIRKKRNSPDSTDTQRNYRKHGDQQKLL